MFCESATCFANQQHVLQISGAVPSSLSRVDENGWLSIKAAAWDIVGAGCAHFFAKEGIEHNVGGEDNRGGWGLMEFTSGDCTAKVLQLLSGLCRCDDDKNGLFDASCLSTMKKC